MGTDWDRVLVSAWRRKHVTGLSAENGSRPSGWVTHYNKRLNGPLPSRLLLRCESGDANAFIEQNSLKRTSDTGFHSYPICNFVVVYVRLIQFQLDVLMSKH